MVRKNLNGGGCGCGSSGLLGFPQAGGGCGCSGAGAGVLPQMGGKGFFGKKSHMKMSMNTASMPKMSENTASMPKMSENTASMPKMSAEYSSTPKMSENSSSMPVNSINTSQVMHKDKQLSEKLNEHNSRISALEQKQPMDIATSSPGLFGGGIFDFLAPKKPLQPVNPVQSISHTTLPQNQPPTLQEVVRDLQFRVKTLEEETRPSTVGGYRATKRNLKALKKYKQGKSIGFTMRSSLKAKGLIPRANGTRRVSKKYRG